MDNAKIGLSRQDNSHYVKDVVYTRAMLPPLGLPM